MPTTPDPKDAGNGASSNGSAASSSSSAASPRAPTNMHIPTFSGADKDYLGWSKIAFSVLQCYGLHDVLGDSKSGGGVASTIASLSGEDEVKESESASSGASTITDQRSITAYTMILMALPQGSECMMQVADVPSGNAFELWDRLKRLYGKVTPAHTQSLMAAFYNAKQERNESITTFSARLKAAVIALSGVGHSVDASVLMHIFIGGLSGSFGQLRVMLAAVCKDFKGAVESALAFEAQSAEDDRGSGSRSQESAHFAGNFSSGRHSAYGGGNAGGNRPAGHNNCFVCNKPGHRSRVPLM